MFKVLSLCADTLLPAVLPLLETFFERVFWNGAQRTRRIFLNPYPANVENRVTS
jgi:hypothetical protein